MKRALLAVALFLAVAMPLPSSISHAEKGKFEPATNHADYWGTSCTKTEMSGEVMAYTTQGDDVAKAIVKGGPTYVVHSSGSFTNLTAPINPNNDKPYGISHVIECNTVSTPVEPTKPVDPVKPTEPTKPTTPTQPTTTPNTPVTPVPPKQPVDVAETTDPAKGSPVTTVTTPTELPNTGISGAAWLLVLMGITVALSYAAKLAIIKSAIRSK